MPGLKQMETCVWCGCQFPPGTGIEERLCSIGCAESYEDQQDNEDLDNLDSEEGKK